MPGRGFEGRVERARQAKLVAEEAVRVEEELAVQELERKNQELVAQRAQARVKEEIRNIAAIEVFRQKYPELYEALEMCFHAFSYKHLLVEEQEDDPSLFESNLEVREGRYVVYLGWEETYSTRDNDGQYWESDPYPRAVRVDMTREKLDMITVSFPSKYENVHIERDLYAAEHFPIETLEEALDYIAHVLSQNPELISSD